jgi:hypothetical protein
MRQTFTVRRTETVKVEVEVVQPLTKATLTQLANEARPVGAPALGKVLMHEVTAFAVLKAEPSCECSAPKARRVRQ